MKDNAVADNETVARHIADLVPYLEKYDMKLVLETHGKEHGTGTVLAEIVRLVGSERVKVNYDTANVVFYGRVDPCEDLKTCLDDVAYVHLKDKAGAADVWDFPALGKGWIDFPGFFKQLEEAGNNSPYSIEIEFTAAGPKDLDEVNQAVKDSAEYLIAQGYTL